MRVVFNKNFDYMEAVLCMGILVLILMPFVARAVSPTNQYELLIPDIIISFILVSFWSVFVVPEKVLSIYLSDNGDKP